ncbi:hypothetical protein BV898_19420 [Hypsibius exemplaris]|uniref:Uncharacterized protein n=1 Tax=Hypsibius exemplaris TaxID=2072580 RepID=A0A9X6NIX7_HYPEX|nr:hypothetical protein BV898_19420 [Hypsibius exemplaris]
MLHTWYCSRSQQSFFTEEHTVEEYLADALLGQCLAPSRAAERNESVVSRQRQTVLSESLQRPVTSQQRDSSLPTMTCSLLSGNYLQSAVELTSKPSLSWL